MARIHRIGQNKSVFIIRLCTGPNTIETRMLEMGVGKRRLENLVVSKKSESASSASSSIAPDNQGKIPESILKTLLMSSDEDLSKSASQLEFQAKDEQSLKNLVLGSLFLEDTKTARGKSSKNRLHVGVKIDAIDG